jgi:hypothetical protein
MTSLKVEATGISQLLGNLRTSQWLVPSFQRDFVWSESDVVSLILSIIEKRPIGMATLWEQPDDSELQLEPILIPDSTNPDGEPVARFSDVGKDSRPKKFYAILDGRQRCTAIAMAFGGLKAKDTRRRYSGRYFLDVTATEPSDRVKYLRETDLKKRGLLSEQTCIAQGLFPLASYASTDEPLMSQWIRYIQAIRSSASYPNHKLPEEDELQRRNTVLTEAFNGINETLLAVYIVPHAYTLGDICEIFETLNTTGTKVSTVDLLHSWLFNDTAKDSKPLHLRDWIDDLGQKEGANGWASRNERPELIAQIITACYLALDDPTKPKPRPVGGKQAKTVSSVKAGDLLATPPEFWRGVVTHGDELARYIGDFQKAVSGAYFPLKSCPYPVTSAIYVSLRWYMAKDPRYQEEGRWTQQEADALFRAFFWRNALAKRYDQGFLTQSAADIHALKEILFLRASSLNSNAWCTRASNELSQLFKEPVLTRDQLIELLTDSRPQGALGRTLALPIVTKPTLDLIDSKVTVSYPHDSAVDLHHIYPRDWCKNNQHGALGAVLDPKRAGNAFVDSIANLVLLCRDSNIWWRAQLPGQALSIKNITYQGSRSIFESLFISKNAFDALTSVTPDPESFWNFRAGDIADELIRLTNIEIRG